MHPSPSQIYKHLLPPAPRALLPLSQSPTLLIFDLDIDVSFQGPCQSVYLSISTDGI